MPNEEKRLHAEDRQIFYDMAVPGAAFVITVAALTSIAAFLGAEVPRAISAFDFVVLALASFRMIRGVSYDKLLRYVRELFKYEKRVVLEAGETFVVCRQVGPGWKRAISTTLECPWCSGVWTTLVALFLYFVSPATYVVILLFAVSGVATSIQLAIHLVAQKYEQLQMKNAATSSRSTPADD